MAKQESLVKFRGKVGDLSFTKHRTRGYEVRMKGGVDKSRIMTDPNFQRTRENMSEFGTAAKTAKLIRVQLNNLLRGTADKTFRNRLTSVVHRIIKSDSENVRGERVFLPENSRRLKGFEFNANSSLEYMFSETLSADFDRSTGEVSMVIPDFDPQNDVTLLEGATHVRFTLAAVEQTLDPEFIPRPVTERSEFIPLIGQHSEETIQVSLPADLDKVVYIIVGIETFLESNGLFYPLRNNPYNAMTIVDVNIP